jgi:8-oxo-dGTP diphosphatase
MTPSYDYARPSLSVDCTVFTWFDDALRILLIKRADDPHKGKWALPGGFVEEGDDLREAALRELTEVTGLEELAGLEQLKTYGDPGRDPRGWIVSVAHLGWVRSGFHKVHPAAEAEEAEWYPVNDLPLLAFDHYNMLREALTELKRRAISYPLPFELLPKNFELKDAVELFCQIDESHSKRKTRSKLVNSRIVYRPDKKAGMSSGASSGSSSSSPGMKNGGPGLYRFDRARFMRLIRNGFRLS